MFELAYSSRKYSASSLNFCSVPAFCNVTGEVTTKGEAGVDRNIADNQYCIVYVNITPWKEGLGFFSGLFTRHGRQNNVSVQSLVVMNCWKAIDAR